MTTRREFIAGAAAATVPLVLGVSGASAAATAPKEVFVVNTQDASVSRVDLGSMKELKQYKVGTRPYGIAVTGDGKTVAVGVEDEECVKFFALPDFKEIGKTNNL
jgi:DNA-binding beta-propeller fold protein YncE